MRIMPGVGEGKVRFCTWKAAIKRASLLGGLCMEGGSGVGSSKISCQVPQSGMAGVFLLPRAALPTSTAHALSRGGSGVCQNVAGPPLKVQGCRGGYQPGPGRKKQQI